MTNHPNRSTASRDIFHRELFLAAYLGKRVRIVDTDEVGEIADAVPHRNGLGALRITVEFVGGRREEFAARDVRLEP